MSKYQVRFNFTAEYIEASKKIRGKITFKTKEVDWINTKKNSIALISIDSSIHKAIDGDLKMNAFISTIREQTSGKISILLADTAHFHAQSIKGKQKTMGQCLQSASLLLRRYNPYFQGCNLLHWSSSIQQDEYYVRALLKTKKLYRQDSYFQASLTKDAEATYTRERSLEHPDKELFIEKTKADLLEQTACILVLSKRGYRYQFYPGAPFASIQYANQILLPSTRQLTWINVFLSIEKKTVSTVSPKSVSSQSIF